MTSVPLSASAGTRRARLAAARARPSRRWGRELGFQEIGIADTELSEAEEHLQRWLAAGRHGDMAYMARHGTARSRPAELVPGTLRVISARMNYWPDGAPTPAEILRRPRARLRLALRARPRLSQGAARAARAARRPHRRRRRATSAIACSPTARRCSKSRSRPRPASGWRGKHTLLLTREVGLVLLPRRDLHRPAAAGDARRDRALRHVQRLHRRVPDRRHRRALRARRAPLHLVSHDRAPRLDSRGAAAADRQPRLRLRRLPARVPVEPVRAGRRRRRLPRGPQRPRSRDAGRALRVDARRSSTRGWPAARSAASATSAGCATSPSALAMRRAARRSSPRCARAPTIRRRSCASTWRGRSHATRRYLPGLTA